MVKLFDDSFLSHVSRQLREINKQMPPLDSGKEHINFFNFKDGTLLDFRKPFAEQLTRVTKDLRISRFSPLAYRDFEALSREREDAIGD